MGLQHLANRTSTSSMPSTRIIDLFFLIRLAAERKAFCRKLDSSCSSVLSRENFGSDLFNHLLRSDRSVSHPNVDVLQGIRPDVFGRLFVVGSPERSFWGLWSYFLNKLIQKLTTNFKRPGSLSRFDVLSDLRLGPSRHGV